MSSISSVIDGTSVRESLQERLRPRLAVERQFAEMGHTYRHGKAFRFFDHRIMRPSLRLGLRAVGLYDQGRRNTLQPNIRTLTLRYQNLPREFDGFRLLHLSDFHIDGVEGLAETLQSILPGLTADVCLLTGDYRFEDRGPCGGVYPRMRKVIESISAEYGIFGILGNHDSAEIAIGMEDLGVRMLVNENVALRRGSAALWIAGVDDPFDYRCADLTGALQGIPAGAFKILLAHAPEIYHEAADCGVNLYLSGHTHAGQIRLPLIGSLKHNSHCPKEFSFGLWKFAGMHGYTTAGIGCSSVPVRFHCPPEIVLIELKRE